MDGVAVVVAAAVIPAAPPGADLFWYGLAGMDRSRGVAGGGGGMAVAAAEAAVVVAVVEVVVAAADAVSDIYSKEAHIGEAMIQILA